MKKLLLTVFIMMSMIAPLSATNYYIRDGGGPYGSTSTTCNGQTNAVFTGNNGPNCAVNHPAWLLGGIGVSQVMSGGDTMYIVGDSDTTYAFTVSGVSSLPAVGDTYAVNGVTYTITVSLPVGLTAGTISAAGPSMPAATGNLTAVSSSGSATIHYTAVGAAQAAYMIGYGMPNTIGSQCASSYAYACMMNTVPQGTSAGQPTAILGIGNHQPQLWGTEGLFYVLDLSAGNYNIQNLEITSHSSCSDVISSSNPGSGIYPGACGGTGGSYPFGPSAAAATWAKVGIQLQGSNVTTSNLWVHRFGDQDINFLGTLTNWSTSNDKFTGAGEFLDTGTGMSFGGNNTMSHDVWAFGGCAEKYPLPDPGNVEDLNNYLNCTDQNAGGTALGGGFMMQNNGNASCGNWTIGDSQFLYNLKTNIDFLHCDGTGTFNMYRSRSEGSSGEALKLHVLTANLEEDQLIGNAPVWTTPAFEAIKAPYNASGSSWDYFVCRGDAVTLFQVIPNGAINYLNDDVTGNCGALIEGANNYNLGCSGMTVNAYNSKFIGGYAYNVSGQQVDFYYDGSSGTTCTSGVPLTMTNDSCYGASTYGGVGCSSGTNTITSDPLVVGESSLGAFTNWLGPNAYYGGTNLANYLFLQSISPLKSKSAPSGVTYTNGSNNDYLGNAPSDNPPDIGAVQQSSCIGATNAACISSLSSQCCSGACSAATAECSFTCQGLATSCTAAASCCTGYCISGSCSACLADNVATSSPNNCCSGLSSGGVCVPYICGDGVMPEGYGGSNKVCDTNGPNVNGDSCSKEGFVGGGTLGCNPGCLSVNTSGCSNTVNFPTVTPPLDTFTRANSTGLGSNWTQDPGATTGLSISSNAATPSAGSGANSKEYWNQATFGENEEIYVTIANVGTNSDDVKMYSNLSPSNGDSYKLVASYANSTVQLFNQTSGASLATYSHTISSGDSFGMDVMAGRITVYYEHAGTWAILGTVTDSSPILAGGVLELGSDVGGGSTPSVTLTNFGGGTYTGNTSCGALGGSCSGSSPCCSPLLCSSGQCASYICGDGIMPEGAKVCDTNGPNLNSQTCNTQGYGSGSISCAPGCLSFNTSACANPLPVNFPTTGYLDVFNRSNASNLGSNWSILTAASGNNAQVVSHSAQGTSSPSIVYWNQSIFGSSEAYATIATKGTTTGDNVQLLSRMNTTSVSGYALNYTRNTSGTDSISIVRYTSGTPTTLVSYAQNVANGDSIGISVIGTTLIAYYKPSAGGWAELGSTTDGTYTTGNVGLYMSYDTTTQVVTNFGGGTAGGGNPNAPAIYNLRINNGSVN